MQYCINVEEQGQLPNIEAALKIVDPGAVIINEREHSSTIDLELTVTYTPDFHVKVFIAGLSGLEGKWEYYDREIRDRRYNEADRRQRLKELIRLGIIAVVSKRIGKTPPLGDFKRGSSYKNISLFKGKRVFTGGNPG